MKRRNDSGRRNLQKRQSLVMDGHGPHSVASVTCCCDDRFAFFLQLHINHPLPALISAASDSTDASLTP